MDPEVRSFSISFSLEKPFGSRCSPFCFADFACAAAASAVVDSSSSSISGEPSFPTVSDWITRESSGSVVPLMDGRCFLGAFCAIPGVAGPMLLPRVLARGRFCARLPATLAAALAGSRGVPGSAFEALPFFSAFLTGLSGRGHSTSRERSRRSGVTHSSSRLLNSL